MEMRAEARQVFRGTAERTEHEIHINENSVSQPQDIQTLLEGTTSLCVLHFRVRQDTPQGATLSDALPQAQLLFPECSRTSSNSTTSIHQVSSWRYLTTEL